MRGVGYISNNHRNTTVYVKWYCYCHILLPKSDFAELCKVLVEEKCLNTGESREYLYQQAKPNPLATKFIDPRVFTPGTDSHEETNPEPT